MTSAAQWEPTALPASHSSAGCEVGFIGLGSQGGPMARRVIDAGFPTMLWARRAGTLEPYLDSAARYAATPAEIGAHCDVIGICVFDDDDVEEVLLGKAGVLQEIRPGAVVVCHSTVRPTTAQRLAREAEARGATLLDAPVSGGGAAATAGTLLVIAGGPDDAFEAALPVLNTFGSPIVRVGGVGTAQAAKLVNNMLFAANLRLARTRAGSPKDLASTPRPSPAPCSLGAVGAVPSGW